MHLALVLSALNQSENLVEVITVSGVAIGLGVAIKLVKSWRDENRNDPRARLHRPRTARRVRKR